ncbi:hypothetical protein CTEN210_04962 [Chaetoceros tenuissimus]|uniref:MYND-type domain-containing protein n=1 Tax=Chaetoceros tenuissimus TaxID=426638 RepID=A0AAD3CP20_9STRA|nr:hypothetical protein CTEN210_04962 [Chaetoceros tenuissimus]
MDSTSVLEAARSISRECIECDAPFCYSKNPLKTCSRCRTSFYCDKKCQKKDWKMQHKEKCSDIKEIKNSIAHLGKDANEYIEKEPIAPDCGLCLEKKEKDFIIVLNDCGHVLCLDCCITRQDGENESKCPTCKVDYELSPMEQLERRLQYFERLADDFQNHMTKEDRFKFGQMALDQASKLMYMSKNDSNAIIGLCMAKSRVLDHMGQYKDALKVLETDCNLETYENEVKALFNFEYLMLKAHIHQHLQEYGIAIEIYEKQLLPLLDENNQAHSWDLYRILCRVARCSYHLGEYEKCIRNSNIVLNYHRHVEDIYEYKARSEMKLGRVHDAVITMNKGVLYETPGDDQNTCRLYRIYEEFCKILPQTSSTNK